MPHAKGRHPARAHIAKLRSAQSKHSKDMEGILSQIESSLGDEKGGMDPQKADRLAQLQSAMGQPPGGVSPLGGRAK